MGEPESLEGKVLAGRYRLQSQLGEGGFGTVWRAEQLVLGATVAVKLIDLTIARQTGALDRFLREAQAAATLRSPHVVQVLDYGVDGDQPFIAMELLEGETLADRLERLGRLAPSEALRIVTHVSRAITRAHECNIVHRDLKPDNVFLVRNEDEEVAKVLDFGVAKIQNPEWVEISTQTRTGSLVGTPHYMSPEQVQGNKTVDFRSDLWSLAVMAFEMFTGERPFVGNALGDLVLQICVRDITPPSHLAPVPVGFDEWFFKAAERDPDSRFQSARDLAQALREVVGGGERDVELVMNGQASSAPDAPASRKSRRFRSSAATHEEKAPAPMELAQTLLRELEASPNAEPQTPSEPEAPRGSPGHSRAEPRKLPAISWVALLLGAATALASYGAWQKHTQGAAASRTSFVPAAPTPSGLPAGGGVAIPAPGAKP